MKKTLFILLILLHNTYAYSFDEYINLGKFKDDNSIFTQKDISKLSQKFLDTHYVSNTLSNIDINTSKENLIINFEALDCFTFIDTIKALKQSNNLITFKKALIDTRYKDSKVTYHNRNHFFSDWLENNNIKDVTCKVGKCQKQQKYLNKNFKYLKEIPTTKRDIYYLTAKNIDTTKLKTGDYVGIFTKKIDLDVAHTGIIIKKDKEVYIRHASSKKKKVIDSLLFEYIASKDGIIVYRD
jgi:hypothetical protein